MSPQLSKLSKLHSPANHNKPSQKIGLMQYVGFFAIGYILASAIFIMIQTQIVLNAQVVTILSILFGAYISVYKFIKHQHRALISREINRLTIASMGIVWLLSALYFLALWLWLFDAISREVLLEMAVEQPLPLLGALIMIVIITLVSTRFSIWLFNKLLAPK